MEYASDKLILDCLIYKLEFPTEILDETPGFVLEPKEIELIIKALNLYYGTVI